MTKFLAITDETTVCECCGKTNLKRVVVLELDNGEIVRYGTTCASKQFKSLKNNFEDSANVLKYVNLWISKYSAEQLSKAVWNKFGYLSRAENNHVQIYIEHQWVTIATK